MPFLFNFTISSKKSPDCLFDTLLRNCLSEIFKFTAYKFGLPPSGRTQFSQEFPHFITWIAFFQFPKAHSSQEVPLMVTFLSRFCLRWHVFSKALEAFSPTPSLLSKLSPESPLKSVFLPTVSSRQLHLFYHELQGSSGFCLLPSSKATAAVPGTC